MTYSEYIAYHNRGDAGVEERLVSSITDALQLDDWGFFRLVYFYAMTYHIPSALTLFRNPKTPKEQLTFRTDRRYVRIGDRFKRMLAGLSHDKFDRLLACRTTSEAYAEVSGWYYFGRYAAFMFLECWYKRHSYEADDLRLKWERDENYTKGAIIVAQSNEHDALDKFINAARKDTQDNVFSLETSLCAVEKIRKGTRWDGYYTERALKEAEESIYARFLMPLIR